MPRQHVVVNAAKVVAAARDSAFRDLVAGFDIINADGLPVVWAARLLGIPIPEQVRGIALMDALVEHSETKGYQVFFLGATPDVVERVVEVYTDRYKHLRVAGYRHGFFRQEEEAALVQQINDSGAHILFVGMPTPRKELFLARYRTELKVPFSMGVGGSFDVVAGKTREAPLWMRRYGLEWLYRLIQEPRRMWRRYLLGNSVFIYLLGKHLFRRVILGRSKPVADNRTE